MESTELLSGKYLSKGTKTTKTIKGLKQLFEYLGKQKQVSNPKQIKGLSSLAGLLVKSHIIGSSDDIITVYVGCCVSEIIRIFAPNAPFTELQLKVYRIYNIMSKKIKLTFVYNIETQENICSNLLQQLVRVKAFLLLIDLDMQLVRNTFTQFLKVSIDDINNQDATNLLNILSLCIKTMAEDDEILDDDILQSILITLLPKFNKRGQATDRRPSYNLAKNLILHCTEELHNSITQFLFVSIQKKGKADTSLYKHYHTLIREINVIAPSILIHILPHLEKEVKSNDKNIRIRACETLYNVLKNNPSCFTHNTPLYDTFLTRNDDDLPEIRNIIVKACDVLLEYHPDCYKQIEHMLGERVEDVDENVRCNTVSVICSAAERNLSIISTNLLESVANRIIDKKPSVRMSTFRALSALYNEIDPSDYDENEYDEKISWIPKKIICAYHYSNWQVKYNVEKAMSCDFLPLEDEEDLEDTRAACLLDIALTFIDEEQIVAAYQKYVKEKYSFQVIFTEFLDALENMGMFDDVDESIFKKIAIFFPECQKLKENMENLTSLSPVLIKEFRILLDPNELTEKQIETYNRALKIKNPLGLNKNLSKDEKEFIKVLIEKANFTHIKPSTIPKMFSHISSRLPKDSEEIPEEVTKLFGFLEKIAEIIPEYFSGCYLQLKAMLTDINEDIVDYALSILSHTAHTLSKQAFSSDILNELKNLCENGTTKQAKCSIYSLAKIYKNDPNEFKTTFEELLEKLTVYLVGGGTTSEKFSTIICSLGCVAEIAPSIFLNYATLLKVFVLKTLFHEDSSFNCETRIYGIRAIVKYALNLDNKTATEEGEQIIKILIKIISSQGDIEHDEIDSSYLRKAAAVGLLKLANTAKYEKQISNKHFLILVQTARDPCYEVRTKILDHLYHGCRKASLRTRYIAFMLLFLCDPERTIAKQAKDYLSNCVSILRQIVKTRASADPRIQLLNPNYVLPFVLFIVSHSFDFENDTPDYTLSAKYIQYFLDATKTQTNSAYMYQFLDWMRGTTDTHNPKYSERMYVLCEIGKAIIRSKSPKNWKEKKESFFTPAIYRRITDEKDLKERLTKKYLPPSFRVPAPTSRVIHTLTYPGEFNVEPYIIDKNNTIVSKKIASLISPKKPTPKRNSRKRQPPKRAKKPAAKKRKTATSSVPVRRSKRATSTIVYDESSEESSEEFSEE